MAMLVFPGSGLAQSHGGNGGGGGHGGGGGGCGDVFGDLVHIKRDARTGQPILQKRWIEYPGGALDWGYCPIPVNGRGEEIGFADRSCDPLDPAAVVELDYFGRLNAGRTKERNSRMHFDEVIANIKTAGAVRADVTGRLQLGEDCTGAVRGTRECAEWTTIDSPMENLALYTRLMKYGHLQTDPQEQDIWDHGDPAAGPRYHPALDADDWAKFQGPLRHLLTADGTAPACFGGGFNPACSLPESLDAADFVRAGIFLAGAANKSGKITVDLVQYLNRILKITLDTETTFAAVDTLPALIRDCGDDPAAQLPPDRCDILPAPSGLPAPADERFVDFARTEYVRADWHARYLDVLIPVGNRVWMETANVNLLDWLAQVHGPAPAAPVTDVDGFVAAAGDGLRTIEFVHNYQIPENLLEAYAPPAAPPAKGPRDPGR